MRFFAMKEQKKYVLEINETQAKIIRDALEEYFRIRMNQWSMLADSLALQNVDLSPENPHHKEIFERFLCKRDHAEIIFSSIGRILGWDYGHKKTEEQMIAEDIWQVIRHEIWKNQENRSEWCVDSREPMQMSGEPLPVIHTK